MTYGGEATIGKRLAVNFRAPFLLSKAAFPRMREAGGGIIAVHRRIKLKKDVSEKDPSSRSEAHYVRSLPTI